MIRKFVQLSLLALLLSSCLKTRSEVAGQDQQYLYGQKNVDNQMAQYDQPADASAGQVPSGGYLTDTRADVQSANIGAQGASAGIVSGDVQTSAVIEDKDALIRSLNGRIETLENQMTTILQEKEAGAAGDAQKITLLQEALGKMELQIQRLENELGVRAAGAGSSDETAASAAAVPEDAGEKAESKKLGAYETAQQHFGKKEWKKAILNFQKYTDESPKGKNVADAKYKIGVSFQELGMKEEAMAFYEEVVANYSKTEAGKSAKARLAKLKK